MTDDIEHQLRQALRKRRRSSSRVAVAIAVAVFAVIAGASAYLWFDYRDQVRSMVFGAPPAAAPLVASGEESISRADFETLKRQTADSLQSAIEDLDAQKANLKNLSDQVSALVARVDALPTAAPATAPVQTGAIPAPPVVRPPLAQRRKPPAPKTSGPISIGGAPLPPASRD